MNFEDCAKKIRKVACQVDVKSCITYVDDEKVIISGEFNLHKLLKTLKKKTGKKIEVVMKTEKLVEDDEPETETPEVVQNQDNKDEIVPQNDDKLETSMMEVEFDIPLLYEEYEKYFEKVISKFEGVETYGTDVENKKIVVIGNFDKDRLLKKLDKKSARLNRKIQQAEKEAEEHKIIEEFCENLDKEAEERKIMAEFCEEIDNGRSIYLT
ncbi:heavy metal-associated isoprenylated plant protein 17 [Capsella rubella]|uniref:heavy metal-associated isoprenylated plant protein 17 n=1 Tax=Capsella rubella TaxID=81985 RepID=UPI000CD5939E|nr:heavy metal-associated isoprenylated plant protein 17 [Capsella rubella]